MLTCLNCSNSFINKFNIFDIVLVFQLLRLFNMLIYLKLNFTVDIFIIATLFLIRVYQIMVTFVFVLVIIMFFKQNTKIDFNLEIVLIFVMINRMNIYNIYKKKKLKV